MRNASNAHWKQCARTAPFHSRTEQKIFDSLIQTSQQFELIIVSATIYDWALECDAIVKRSVTISFRWHFIVLHHLFIIWNLNEKCIFYSLYWWRTDCNVRIVDNRKLKGWWSLPSITKIQIYRYTDANIHISSNNFQESVAVAQWAIDRQNIDFDKKIHSSLPLNLSFF